MTEDVPPASWSLLPTEVLERIFDHVPRLLLPVMARVCTGWRNTLHRLAVKYLTLCIQTRQGWENPGFKKKTSPVGFLGFFLFFLMFFLFFFMERVFRVFSVSRILLGASRL
jgi:hypothetical protein